MHRVLGLGNRTANLSLHLDSPFFRLELSTPELSGESMSQEAGGVGQFSP